MHEDSLEIRKSSRLRRQEKRRVSASSGTLSRTLTHSARRATGPKVRVSVRLKKS